MTDRVLMQQALEALEFHTRGDEIDEALITALRERLAQPVQEPVAWMKECADFWEHYMCIPERSQDNYDEQAQMWIEKLRTAPQPRQWQGLTDDEISACWGTGNVVAAVEAKLREKNA